MSSPKFRVALGSVLIIAAPLALFLIRYLQANPFESLFTIDSIRTVLLTALLSVFGIFFVFLAGMVIPGMFSTGADVQPDYSAWAIGCGVVIAMFVTLNLSLPATVHSDPRNERIEIRSLVLYVDPDDTIHDHTYCSDEFEVDDYQPVAIKDLVYNEDFYYYDICDTCNYAFYDEQNDLIHYFYGCINVPEGDRVDLKRIDSIFEYVDYSLDNLCPYCY